jgi:hypothetical protein
MSIAKHPTTIPAFAPFDRPIFSLTFDPEAADADDGSPGTIEDCRNGEVDGEVMVIQVSVDDSSTCLVPGKGRGPSLLMPVGEAEESEAELVEVCAVVTVFLFGDDIGEGNIVEVVV